MTTHRAEALQRPIERDPLAAGLMPEQLALMRRMPKAELHLHLDGSLRPATALELARERGLDAGMEIAEMAERLIGPERAADQAELLRAFDLPIAILQDAESLTRVSHELVEDVATDGTRYVEIRWGPALHVERGLSLRDGIAAVVAGVRSGAVSAGGGPGIVVRLIAVALRSHAPGLNVDVAREAARFLGDGLTGFDLAGREAAFPDPLLHAEAFELARAAGLGITVHAGEWGGAAQVRRALVLDPERIAHGPLAIDDPDLVRELIARGVWLDLCPTSNAQASIVASIEGHPLRRLLHAGVSVTLSTDDLTVSDVTLSDEYVRAVERIGVTLPELWALDLAALEAAFCDEPTRDRLRAAFRAWGDGIPELGQA